MYVSMRRFSTDEVAGMLGMHRPNLQRLIREKSIPFPPIQQVGKIKIRLWTQADVEKARKAIETRLEKK